MTVARSTYSLLGVTVTLLISKTEESDEEIFSSCASASRSVPLLSDISNWIVCDPIVPSSSGSSGTGGVPLSVTNRVCVYFALWFVRTSVGYACPNSSRKRLPVPMLS